MAVWINTYNVRQWSDEILMFFEVTLMFMFMNLASTVAGPVLIDGTLHGGMCLEMVENLNLSSNN